MAVSNEITFRTPAATANKTPLQVDVYDVAANIERMGGKVAKFWIGKSPEPSYEVTLDGENYGPMGEAELHWFACGLSQ